MLADFMIRLRSLLRRKNVEKELDEELRFHFEAEVEKQMAAGADLTEAHRRARVIFGAGDLIKEECRQARGVTLVETIAQDVRHAFRTLRKNPAFAAMAILTLALGVGATTVAFSVVDSILFNPIPFKDADRLVQLWSFGKTGGGPRQPAAMLRNWRAQSQIFEQVEAHWETSFALTGAGDPAVTMGSQITVGLLRFLGVHPELGRDFAADDHDAAVALISHDLWTRRFGADPHIIGSVLHLNGDIYTVVGVMPAAFKFPSTDVDLWIPFDPLSPQSKLKSVSPIARLRRGLNVMEADKEVAALAPQLDPSLLNDPDGYTARVRPMNPYDTQSFLFARLHDLQRTRTALFLLLGAAGLVLLASCANSANLFLSRAMSRSHELAVRAAIGGSRLRLACSTLSEGIVLASIAGICGLLLAYWSLRGIATIVPPNLLQGSLRPLAVDTRSAIWTAIASLSAGLIAAAAPMLRFARRDVSVHLSNRFETGRRNELRLRGLLIAVETALALILLIGAGLTVRTLWTLSHPNTGWSSNGFVVIEPQFRGPRYSKPENRTTAMTRLSEQMTAIPGVQSAAISYGIPLLYGDLAFGPMQSDNVSLPDATVTINRVTGSYFKTLGIPLFAGRTFDAKEDPNSAVITRQLAETLWPGVDPVGKRVRLGKGTVLDWVTVVGVVGDIQSSAYDSSVEPLELYRPFSADLEHGRIPLSGPMRFLAVKTDGRENLSSAFRAQIRQLDPDLPVKIQSMSDIYGRTLAQPVFQAMVLGGFALLTVLLALAGVYAVVGYEVSKRTQEIGIRVALGASERAVVLEMMRRFMLLVVCGAIAGIAASFALTRLMSSMLYEVRPTDPVTFLAGTLLLLASAGTAAYLPARRASRVDPLVALRHD